MRVNEKSIHIEFGSIAISVNCRDATRRKLCHFKQKKMENGVNGVFVCDERSAETTVFEWSILCKSNRYDNGSTFICHKIGTLSLLNWSIAFWENLLNGFYGLAVWARICRDTQTKYIRKWFSNSSKRKKRKSFSKNLMLSYLKQQQSQCNGFLSIEEWKEDWNQRIQSFTLVITSLTTNDRRLASNENVVCILALKRWMSNHNKRHTEMCIMWNSTHVTNDIQHTKISLLLYS